MTSPGKKKKQCDVCLLVSRAQLIDARSAQPFILLFFLIYSRLWNCI